MSHRRSRRSFIGIAAGAFASLTGALSRAFGREPQADLTTGAVLRT